MIPLKSRPQTAPSSSYGKRSKRRFSPQLLIGAGVLLALLLVAGAVITTQNKGDSHAASRDDNNSGYNDERNDSQGRITTINGLKNIAVVGSTADILDKNGNKITVNPDPYGVAIAPDRAGNGLRKGDILVTNLGNDKKGMTIVKYAAQKGPGVVFNKPNTDGTLGPTMLNFDQNGKLWVANSTGNDVLVFNPNGTLMATVKNAMFNGPWGIVTNGKRSVFVANKLDAKILRIDIMDQDQGMPTFKVTQIAQFDKMPDATKIALIWRPTLKVGNQNLKDVLLALDPTNNRIAALPNSTKLNMNGNQNMNGTGTQAVNGTQDANGNQITAQAPNTQAAIATQGTQNVNGTQSVNGTQDANGNQITTQAPNTQAAMATQVAQAANGNQVTTPAPDTQAAVATQVAQAANNNNVQTTAPVQTTNTAQGMGKGVTVFQGKPLNTPGGFAINPLNGDLLVTNLADNNLVELNMNKQTVVGVKQIDPMAVDNQGNGSALFGVAAIKDEQGNLRVFFTDDNTNSLNVLRAK